MKGGGTPSAAIDQSFNVTKMGVYDSVLEMKRLQYLLSVKIIYKFIRCKIIINHRNFFLCNVAKSGKIAFE